MQITEEDEDQLVWLGRANGEIAIKIAYMHYSEKNVECHWLKFFWLTFVPPKLSVFAWKMVNNRIAIGAQLCRRNIIPAPLCVRCIVRMEEDLSHLILPCPTSINLWIWLSDVFSVNFTSYTSVHELLEWCARNY